MFSKNVNYITGFIILIVIIFLYFHNLSVRQHIKENKEMMTLIKEIHSKLQQN